MSLEVTCYGDGTLWVEAQRVGRLTLPEGSLRDKVARALDGVPLHPEDPDDALEEYERVLKEIRATLQTWQEAHRSSREALANIAEQVDYEQRPYLRPVQAREMRPGDLGLRWVTPTLMSLPEALNAELREV